MINTQSVMTIYDNSGDTGQEKDDITTNSSLIKQIVGAGIGLYNLLVVIMLPLVEEVFVGHGLKLYFGYEYWSFELARQNHILIDDMKLWAIIRTVVPM